MNTAILFDLDGTLLDTLPDLLAATNHILCQAGYPELSGEALRRIVGNGAANQLRKALPPGTPEEVVQALVPRYKAYYAAHCRENTRPYEGIPQALQALREHPMAIVSNKPEDAVKSLCSAFFPGLPAFGEAPGQPRKPDPAMVHRALARLGADRCIYVGDSEVDLLTAANAGCPCLSVTWGFRDRQTLEAAGATRLCTSPESLVPMLRAMLLDAPGEL